MDMQPYAMLFMRDILYVECVIAGNIEVHVGMCLYQY